MTAFRAFWTLVKLLINFIQKEVFFWRVELSTVEEVLAETQSLGHLGCTGGGGLERLAKFGLLLLVAAFFCTDFFAWIYIAIFMLGLGPGSFLLISSTMFYPLGGLFNLLVFTRPSVWILRRRHSYSWLKAFVLVIKAGGEVPHEFRDNEPKNEVPRKSPTPLRPSSQDRNMISTGEEEEMIRNLSSVETPPVSFARMLISSGLVEESEKSLSSPGNRKFYHNDAL